MKSNNKIVYQFEYYRSNGSPEIYVFYDVHGLRICKMQSSRSETKYSFIKKGFDAAFFENLKLIKYNDLDL